MSKKFQKRVEDFVCGNCGHKVNGTGYTNHCPACLWSKHVDVHPGDRLAKCGGLMEPLGLTIKGSAKIIVHHCITCGHKKFNEAQTADDANALIGLSTKVFKVNKVA